MNNKINSNEYLTKYFNGTRLYPINLINYFKYISTTYNIQMEFSSATLNKIKSITNKYLADKRIYISEITPQSYYHLSRGNGKSIRELCYFLKLILNSEKSQFSYDPYSPEYTVQNYKSDIENLYKAKICKKIFNSYTTQNIITKQRFTYW